MLHESIHIKSRLNDYTINWNTPSDQHFREVFEKCRVGIVDKNVYDIYGSDPHTFGKLEHIILQEAEEELKTADASLSLCSRLLELGFKRGETLLAVGGGIIQDLVTFSASILFRGVPWIFIPTTLLAQADSCIGGKSSINFGKWKNQLGNFYPPREIFIAPHYLRSLTDVDIRSGLGEILKVHCLAGADMVEKINSYFSGGQADGPEFNDAIFRALKEKAEIIQEDEFDTGKRLTLNFGHTFGHALETATGFALSHGIAVAVGVDMATFLAMKLNRISESDFQLIHSLVSHVVGPEAGTGPQPIGHAKPLSKSKESSHENEISTNSIEVNLETYIDALRHDKKNTADQYCFILPYEVGRVEKVFVPMGEEIEQHIMDYFSLELPGLWSET